jgi:hypothetical protein
MAKRTDANQKEIVQALRNCGASVFILSDVGKGCPDLLIGLSGRNYLGEVKDGKKPPSGQKLTEKEQLFFNSWKGQVCILKSLDDVAIFINSVRNEY